jgi:methylmalonyl-CoA decarboxylase
MSTEAQQPIASSVADGIGTITLTNAARRNALSHTMMDAIAAALAGFQQQSVRVVIIQAEAGARVWSSGHDIGELPVGGLDPLRYADPLEHTLRAIRRFPGPVIAKVRGSVWGGAFDLVLSCDLVVADPTATFAITPVNLGVPYNTTGLLHFMGRLRLNVIKELFFTAAPAEAAQALEWGIINWLVPAGEIDDFTAGLAQRMAAKAPLAMAVIKEQLRVLSDEVPIAAQTFERLQDMRRMVYDSADFREGIAAFHEKRAPRFTGR